MIHDKEPAGQLACPGTLDFPYFPFNQSMFLCRCKSVEILILGVKNPDFCGGKVPRQTDFSPQFSKIRKSDAQELFTVQAASPGVPLTKQWADTKLPVHQAGHSMASQVFNFWDKTGGKCYGEVTQLINGGRAPITEKTIPFYDKYVNRYGISPTYSAFGIYDALYALKAAAEKCNSLDTGEIIKALEKIRYGGAAGVLAFDEYHDSIYGEGGKQPVWVQWQGPRKMEVIYPFKWQTAEYIPPPWMK